MSYSRTRIKICGLRELEDVRLVSQLGVDAIGLVFHQRSPRAIELLQAMKIRQQLAAFVTLTALFSNETEAWVAEVIDRVKPDLLQFHGQESAQYCEQWGLPYIKAVAMSEPQALAVEMSQHINACGFLLDSHGQGQQGGSGQRFDWNRFPAQSDQVLILAGGLSPDNVAAAIEQTRPWGVDVSSGVESQKGVKDAAKIQQFVQEVKRVDCSQ